MQTTGEFLVSVRDFRATVSATKPIYIKGNFDNFKTFKTGSVRGTDVSWSDEVVFEYTTSRIDRMKDKIFRLDVWQDILGPDRIYGSVEMDLHTLASGPVLQDLPIIDGVTSVGRLTFSVEMKEVRAMRVAHREVRMTLDPADDGKVSGPVSLRVWYRNDPAGIRNSVATPFAKMVPEMQRLVFKDSFEGMFSSGLSYGIVSGNAVVSEGVLDFRSNYSFTLGDVRTITVNLTGTLRVTVTANITFENMPRYVQMAEGVHSETGIRGGKYLVPDAPERPNCYVEAVGGDPVPAAREALRSMSVATLPVAREPIVSQRSVATLPVAADVVESVRLDATPLATPPKPTPAPFFSAAQYEEPVRPRSHSGGYSSGGYGASTYPSDDAYRQTPSPALPPSPAPAPAPAGPQYYDVFAAEPAPAPAPAPVTVQASAPQRYPSVLATAGLAAMTQPAYNTPIPAPAPAPAPAPVASYVPPSPYGGFPPQTSTFPTPGAGTTGFGYPTPTPAAAVVPRPAVSGPLPSCWERKIDPATGREYYMNHVLKKTFWELPTKTELEVHLMSRPFGMELGANDRSTPSFFANPHSPRGVIINNITPEGDAIRHPELQVGMIITHINGAVVENFPSAMATLQWCSLPCMIRVYNPFSITAPPVTAPALPTPYSTPPASPAIPTIPAIPTFPSPYGGPVQPVGYPYPFPTPTQPYGFPSGAPSFPAPYGGPFYPPR